MSYAVTVLSGGMDSTVLAHLSKGLNEKVDLVSVDYGQRHRTELEFAARTADKLGCRHDVVSLPIGEALSSALTDTDVDVPHGHYAEDNMAVTVVPNRNAILISVAYGIAVARGATTVQVGVHAGDHFVYPDCRPAFVDQLGVALKTGNEGFGQVELVAPFVHQSKTDICRLGDVLGVDWTDTWSCYEGGAVHCGRCGTCVERREAFRDAGVEDPTEYADPDYAFEVLARGSGS
ncbi:7-cyano-7-deazaguanine synthase QueC [Euzebya pacifica]|nr:7-cyano-7-deazaguanine synthase QueC [Euzebya pacifica]